jgi:adenylyltransferase/sulfurtransferase
MNSETHPSPISEPISEPRRLSPPELQRYARHLTLPEVGLAGQEKLKAARVLCIGAGGLGSPVAFYLAAAGVGAIGIVDPDVVDASNLQRQILHGQSDIGRSKLDSAADTLGEINPHVSLELFNTTFTRSNAMEIAAGFDIVIDGTDNFPTRYLSNDVCVFLRKPNVYGSIFRFEGQCSVFAPHLGGPCYRCMFPEPPDPGTVSSCAEGGVLGVLPGIIGSLQALEAIKLILGVGETLAGRLVHFDALRFRFREFKLRRDPDCPVCGANASITEPIDYDQFCGIPAPGTPPLASENAVPTITVEELHARRQEGAPFLLIDVREPYEHEICRIEGAKLIPLGQLAGHLDKLDRGAEIILHCKSGGRSEQAVRVLQEHGFKHVMHVAGGILSWAEAIDPSLAKY